jgi:hypothetical protein
MKRSRKFDDILKPLLAVLPFIFSVQVAAILIIGFLPDTYIQIELIVFLSVLAFVNVFFGKFTMVLVAHCFTVKKKWLKNFSYPAGVLLVLSVILMATVPIGLVSSFFIRPGSIRKSLIRQDKR